MPGRRNDVTDPPARHAVGLRHPIHDDRAFAHAVQRDGRDVRGAVVKNVLVDFVGDRQNVPLLAEPGDDFEFLRDENLAGRIVRRIDNDGFGLVVECRGQFRFIERPVRTREAERIGELRRK